MPGDTHERAVRLIEEMLIEEFKDQEPFPLKGMRLEYGCTPDLIISFPDDTMLVVEVGHTKPSKIHKYLSDDNVREIRWYDKAPHPVAVWGKKHPVTNHVLHLPNEESNQVKKYYSIKDKVNKEKNRLLELRKETKCYTIDPDTFTICPFCLKRYRLKDGKLNPWASTSFILSCSDCTPTFQEDLDTMVKFYKEFYKPLQEQQREAQLKKSREILNSLC